MFYLVTGKEAFLRDEFVGQLRARMFGLPMGEHNIDEFGPEATVDQVIATCEVVPFLCDKRMVIVRGLLARAGRPRARGRRATVPAALTPAETLAAYVPGLPSMTHLVVVEDDRATVDTLAAAVPDAVRRDCTPPRDEAMPRWIAERAAKWGGTIDPRAAIVLAQLVGADLRCLDAEIAKLTTFAASGAAISVEDVRTLVAGGGPDIFTFQDAVAERRAGTALATTHQLLERGHDAVELLGQLSGLIRRLLIVKELVASRRSVAQEAPAFGLSSSPFFLQKLQRQVARLSADELERAYLVLRDTDLAIKTGQMNPDLAIELAVSSLVGLGIRTEVA